MMSSLGWLIPVAVLVSIVTLVLMIVFASAKRTQAEKIHVIQIIYHYAIAFITLIMVIGGGISLFMALSDLVAPASDNAFDSALNDLIQSFGWIVIPGPIFLYMQKRIRKTES